MKHREGKRKSRLDEGFADDCRAATYTVGKVCIKEIQDKMLILKLEDSYRAQ